MDRLIQSFAAMQFVLPSANVHDVTDGQLYGAVIPLWRHLFWVFALFVVLAVAVGVRLDVQQLRKDLDLNERYIRSANVLNERLHLELDTRRRAEAVEDIATRLGANHEVDIIRIVEPK